MKFNTKDQNIFFSADVHYSHKNICGGVSNWVKPFGFVPKPDDDREYAIWPIPYADWKDDKARKEFCTENGLRDFPTIEKMNSTIVNNFNQTIGQNDILFLIGAVGFGGKESVGEFMKRLTCKNVYLIFGNHDRNIENNIDGVRGYFKSCDYYKEIYVDGQHIVLLHYAMRVWNKSHRGSLMLYGHSHGSLPDDPNALSIDVGVDTNDMMPYSFEEIKKIMQKKTYQPIDHHREQ